MKNFVAILILSLVASVQGQEICGDALAKVPDCVRSCIEDAGRSVGCEVDDLQCSCDPAKQADISSTAIDCILQACGVEKGLQVSSVGAEICSCAATGFPNSASTSLGQSISSSPTSTSASASSLAAVPNQSTINGPTIAVAVGISISSVILIIAIFLIRQRRSRRRRKTGNEKFHGQNHTANEVYEPSRMINKTHEPEATHELSAHQEYELPANPNTLRHELPP